MKLRTRLLITFGTMVILPLVLMAVAYMSIGTYMTHTLQREYGFETVDYETLSNSIQNSGEQTELLFYRFQEIIQDSPEKLEDKTFLSTLNSQAVEKGSYIIVRKGQEMYYTGSQKAASRIFQNLPPYGHDTSVPDTGYYYNQLQKLVKQADFVFSDGSDGSIFIVTPISKLFSQSFLMDMMIAITLILLFTACMLTQWIHKGVFRPIRNLNTAMQKIAEGNLDYSLTTEEKGEFGDLFRNYEDMRLRLKESTEEIGRAHV